MFSNMVALDHAIHDLILVRLRRPGLSGPRFGVLDDPGFAASLMRALTSPDARGEPPRGYGSWLLRGSLCLPKFPVCRWTNLRTANSSIPGPSRCRSNAPRLSRAEDGTGMGKTRNDCVTTEQAAAHPGSRPRTLGRCRARDGGPAHVSCCNRVHELRSGLDGRIAEHERLAAAGLDDDCGRDGQKIAIGENKFVVVPQRRGAYACRSRSSQECQMANIKCMKSATYPC